MERLTPAGVPIYDSDAFGWSMRGGMLQSPTHIAQRGYSHGFRDGTRSARVPSGGGSSDTSWQQALGGLPMPSKPSVSAANSALKTIWTKLGGTIATCLAVTVALGADIVRTAPLGQLNEDSNVVVRVDSAAIERLVSDSTNGIPEAARSYADAVGSGVLAAMREYGEAASNNVLAAANARTDEASNNVLTAAIAYTDAHSGTDPEAVRAIVAGEIATATGGLRRVTDNESRMTEAGRWIPGAVYWGGADCHPLEDQPTFGDWTWTWAVAGTGGSARFEAEGDADAVALTFRGRGTLPPSATFSAELASPSSVSGETFVTSSYVTNRAASALAKATAHADAAAADALVSAYQYADGVGAGAATAGTNYTDAATGTLSRAFGPRIGSEMRDLLSKTNATDIASEFETNSVVGRLANDRIGFDVRGDTLSFVDGDSVLWSCRNGGGGGVDPEDVREIVEPMIAGKRDADDFDVLGETEEYRWSDGGIAQLAGTQPVQGDVAWSWSGSDGVLYMSDGPSPESPDETLFVRALGDPELPPEFTSVRLTVTVTGIVDRIAKMSSVDPKRDMTNLAVVATSDTPWSFRQLDHLDFTYYNSSLEMFWVDEETSSLSGYDVGWHVMSAYLPLTNPSYSEDADATDLTVYAYSPGNPEYPTVTYRVTRKVAGKPYDQLATEGDVKFRFGKLKTALDSLDASTATVSELINALKGALEEQQ